MRVCIEINVHAFKDLKMLCGKQLESVDAICVGFIRLRETMWQAEINLIYISFVSQSA